ncbi:MAG: hypothetical protein JWN39_3307, partial [Ilumatobacteraceae bacterium]|nr:hypothetical protein [Ilumatobacteraceae bacterium]
MSRPTDPEDHSTDDGADARIDAMARDAGNQLRRPAPVDGPARAQRTRRNKASVRAALAITAAVAVMAVGAVVLTSRDKQTGLVPAISVATTEPT